MKKVFFLGQAPAKPNSKHTIPGTYLHAWLHHIGLRDEDIQQYCSFYALTDTFPGSVKGGHIPPKTEQILLHKPFLIEELKRIQPDVIVPVGKMAITELLQVKDITLTGIIGTKFSINPFNALDRAITCIPFSHPSGRSAWNALHSEAASAMLVLLKQAVMR